MCKSNHVDKFMHDIRSSRGHGKKFMVAHPLATMTSGLILHDVNTTKWKCKPVCPSPKEIGRHPRLSTTSVMAALLHWTPVILNDAHINGLTVCMRRRNLLQTLELRNSLSCASQLKAFSRFNGKRAAPSSSASSSVILATSNIQAHGLQVQYSIPLIVRVENMSPSRRTDLGKYKILCNTTLLQQIFFCCHMTFIINFSYRNRKKTTVVFTKCSYVNYVFT
jgi:hypothetical protein